MHTSSATRYGALRAALLRAARLLGLSLHMHACRRTQAHAARRRSLAAAGALSGPQPAAHGRRGPWRALIFASSLASSCATVARFNWACGLESMYTAVAAPSPVAFHVLTVMKVVLATCGWGTCPLLTVHPLAPAPLPRGIITTGHPSVQARPPTMHPHPHHAPQQNRTPPTTAPTPPTTAPACSCSALAAVTRAGGALGLAALATVLAHLGLILVDSLLLQARESASGRAPDSPQTGGKQKSMS